MAQAISKTIGGVEEPVKAARKATFTALAKECELLDEAIDVQKNNYCGPAAMGQWTWDPQLRASLLGILSPDWDGMNSARGRSYRGKAAAAAAAAFICCDDAPAPDCVAALLASLDEIASREGPAGKSIPSALDLACAAASRRHARGYHAVKEEAPAARAVLGALFSHASPGQLARFATSFASRADLLRDLSSPEFVAHVYAQLFSRGVELEQVLSLAPQPGKSVADQCSRLIGKMPPGAARSVLQAQFDRKSMSTELGQGSGIDGAWDAKGLPVACLTQFQALVARLEASCPGRGADEAIAWLESHPRIKAKPAAAAAASRKEPKPRL